MVYGLGTRSYNRSREARLNKEAVVEATKKYLETQQPEIMLPFPCTCRSFRDPHDPARHSELRSDYDWRTWKERGA